MAKTAAWGILAWAAWLAVAFLRGSFKPDDLAAKMAEALGGPYDWSGFGATWLAHARGLAGAAMALAGMFGVGIAAARLWRAPGLGSPVFTAAAGLAISALALAGLGFSGLLHPALIAVLVLAGAFAGRRGFPPAWSSIRSLAGGGVLERVFQLATGACLLLYLGPALTPEMGWDAMTYHLRVPSHYLAAHRIYSVPFSLGSFYPFTAEMWFMLGQALGGDTGAKLLNYSFLPLTILALAGMGKEAGAPAAGWLAGLLFASLPAAGILSVQCYNDLEAAFFTVAAVWAALRPTGGRILLAGLLAGAATGCKYSGAMVLLLVLALGRIGGAGRRAGPGALALAAAACALAVAPWPLRVWLHAGNPVYPMLANSLAPSGWNPYFTPEEASRLWGTLGPQASAWKAMVTLARFPLDFSWNMTALGAVFGPLLFGMIPLAFLRVHGGPGFLAGRAGLALAGSGLAYALMWLVTRAGDGRYLLPMAALFAYPAAAGVLGLGAFSAGLRWAFLGLAAAVGLVQAMSWTALVTGLYEPWRSVAGLESRMLYLSRGLQPHYEYAPMAELIDRRLPPRARVLMFSDILSYYINREVVFDTQQVTPPVAVRLVRRCGDPAALRKRFRQLGLEWVYYTPLHVMAFQRDCNCLRMEDGPRACYEKFWRRYAVLEFEYGGLKMFRLKGEAEAARTRPAPFAALPGPLDVAQAEAEGFRGAGDFARAGEVLGRFVKANPDMWEARVRLAESLLMQGRHREVAREMDIARRLGGDSSPLWMMTANARAHLGDRPGALEAARNAVDRSPTPRALTLLAVGLANMGDLSGAKETIRKASEMDPYDQDIKRIKAQLP